MWLDSETVIVVIGIVSSVVGILWFLWYTWEKLFPIRRLRWKIAERSADRITRDMARDGFSPTLIIGIGRGGAVMGALISGALGHRPLLVLDRKYVWIEGRRYEDMLIRVNIPFHLLERVLLVAGEAHSGNTMKRYHEIVKGMGAVLIRRATLYYEEDGCTEGVEYTGLKSSKKKVLMPWMYTPSYIREDRSESQARESRLVDYPSPIARSEGGTKVFLVRHGESVDNASGDRFSGVRNSELTKKGFDQAMATGRMLQPEKIDRVYTSSMNRTVSTARAIQSLTQGALVIESRLREVDYGDWEGLTRQDVNQRFSEDYSNWKKDPMKYWPTTGENPEDALKRALTFLSDLESTVVAENLRAVVVVTHKSIIRMLLCHLHGYPLSQLREIQVSPGSISEITLERSGNIQIRCENEVGHLSE